MSLDKAISHGKEYRAPYHGSKSFDRICRNHGSCLWCAKNIVRALMAYFKRPRCMNSYRCGDCIHCVLHYYHGKFKGISCDINAR